MATPDVIVPERIRNIRHCTFGWVDHNFLHRGFLGRMSQEELLLYYFLITVADKSGMSFYDYARICQVLKMEADAYLRARDLLCEHSLIAYREGVFQVLPLPQGYACAAPAFTPPVRTGDFQALKAILQTLSRET